MSLRFDKGHRLIHSRPDTLGALISDLSLLTDKNDSEHGYTQHYLEHFRLVKNDKIRILELGIAGGGSLRLWEEFFPNAEVIGADVREACREIPFKRARVVIGNLRDLDFLYSLALMGPYDIIIDDASHIGSDQFLAFSSLFPSVVGGGVYIVEDTYTSYLDAFNGGPPGVGSVSAIEMIKNLVDTLHYEGWRDTEDNPWFDKYGRSYQKSHPVSPDGDLYAIHIYKGTTLIFKNN